MAYSLATVSPNSWQLQRSYGLAPFTHLSCKPPAFVHCGVRRVGRTIRSSAVAGDADEGTKGPAPQSWLDADSSTNSYAGWFSADENPPGNKRAGYLAAGAAGLILTVGFAFASHSLYARRGVRHQPLVPLTAKQERILSSDGSNSAVDGHLGDQGQVTESDALDQKQNEEFDIPVQVPESEVKQTAGTDRGFLPHEETNNLSFEAGDELNVAALTVSIQNVELEGSKSGVVDVMPVTDSEDVEAAVAASSPLVDSTTIAKSDNIDAFAAMPDSESSSIVMSESAINELSVVAPFSENKPVSQAADSDKAASVLYSEPDHSSTLQSAETGISVISVVSESSSINTHIHPLAGELGWKEKESLVEGNSTITDVSDYIFPSDSATLEPTIPLKPSIIQTSSAVPSNVPEMMEGTNQSVSSKEDSFASEIISSVIVTDVNVPSTVQKMSESGLYRTDDALELDEVDSIELNARRTSMLESCLPSSESEHSFTYAGIPAPSVPCAALHVVPGKVVVPAVVDHVQGQALAALQALKVVEAGIIPGDLCSRREYARWLIAASAVLARNPVSKVFPAMFIENVTELAFDDVTPEDPDFPFIQGLAEAGLISSKLSSHDKLESVEGGKPNDYLFSPDSPLSRQDLICWKIALEKRQLPEVSKKALWEKSGFIDIDKINQEAWPALSADMSSGEQSIMALAFGYTRLFQPDKPVTKSQAAVALATGEAAELVMEELARIEAESLADTAVATHASLEAQVQKDLNASFEKKLELEREKIIEAERLAEEARLELLRLIAEREEEKYSLMRDQAAIDSERQFLSKLRHEVEEQVQALSINKLEISFERDQVARLRKEAEDEKQALAQLRSEVDVEKKALSMARTWAEDEAKKAREHAKVLEEARERWERLSIQVHVDKELDEDKILPSTWQYSPEVQKHPGQSGLHDIIARAKDIRGKLWLLSNDLRGKVLVVIEKIIQALGLVITSLQQRAGEMAEKAHELQREALVVTSKAVHNMQHTTASTVAVVTSYVKEGTKRLADDCREGAEKISQKFKT